MLFRALATIILGDVSAGNTILLHLVAFAGWLGRFITALNLLPLGQLDGGHILYALSGRGQRVFASVFLLAVLPLGLLWWGGGSGSSRRSRLAGGVSGTRRSCRRRPSWTSPGASLLG